MLVSAVQQHESAIYISSLLSVPSPSHPSRSSQSTELSSLLYSSFPVAHPLTLSLKIGKTGIFLEALKEKLKSLRTSWDYQEKEPSVTPRFS